MIIKSLKIKISVIIIFIFSLSLYAESINFDRISKAVEFLKESIKAYDEDQIILSKKKLLAAKNVLDSEFKKGKIFNTIILKESNGIFYVTDYLDVNELNGSYPILSFTFFTNNKVNKDDLINKKITKKDITSDAILEIYELGKKDVWSTGNLENGTFYSCSFEIIEITTDINWGTIGTLDLNREENTRATYVSSLQYEAGGVGEKDSFDIRINIFCKILSIREIPASEVLSDDDSNANEEDADKNLKDAEIKKEKIETDNKSPNIDDVLKRNQ